MATRTLTSGAESCNGGHDERLHDDTIVAEPSSLQPRTASQQNRYCHQWSNSFSKEPTPSLVRQPYIRHPPDLHRVTAPNYYYYSNSFSPQVGDEKCTSLMLGGGRQEYSSEESALDHDPLSLMSDSLNRHSMSDCPSPTEGPPHTQTSAAACFHWPASSRLHGTAEERSAYFSGLQKTVVDPQIEPREPLGQQATTLLDLMTIRAFHTKDLRRSSLGTAVGFRTRGGVPTNIPAIIVFVARKVHEKWLLNSQKLPKVLEGPGGIWCDVDVVEFSCDGASSPSQKEQVHTELVEGLRGNDPCIGPGSQVASQETYGTLGAIVQSRTGACQVGFLTNRHVAVNLDYPNQKMFHPMPPNLGQGVYLGAVERATSFITDDLWYGIFASTNPETFVRADGAFIPFADYFNISKVTTTVKGVGDIGEVMSVDLQAPIDSIVGKRVVKVGRSSGLTRGSIMAYALEYNDEKGICVFTDFLIIGGENGQAFDLEGDSGSLILLDSENGEKPRPVGIIWGGTANRGRLKLRKGDGPENWTIGVDLGKLLERLQLELITNDRDLKEAVEDERNYWNARFGMGSTMAESSSVMALGLETEKAEVSRPTYIEEMPCFSLYAQPQIQDVVGEDSLLVGALGHREWGLNLEPNSSSPATQIEVTECGSGLEAKRKGKEHDISHASNEGCEDLSAGFDFFEREAKRRKHKTCMFFT